MPKHINQDLITHLKQKIIATENSINIHSINRAELESELEFATCTLYEIQYGFLNDIILNEVRESNEQLEIEKATLNMKLNEIKNSNNNNNNNNNKNNKNKNGSNNNSKKNKK